MTDALADLAAKARATVARGYYRDAPRAPRGPSFVEAVRDARGVVAEIKPASPAGPLRDVPDPGRLARALADAGAVGVSVLTEPDVFRGSLRNLAAASGCGAPTLMKDFVVDPAQLDAAAACGASAVLLILPLHERKDAWGDAEEAVAAAHARGLEVLIEVYDADGFRRAQETEADVIGVNNRDLRTLELDPARFERVLRATGKDRPVMALSGVSDAAGARRMFDAGADAVLVGSALMRAPDPAAKLREVIG